MKLPMPFLAEGLLAGDASLTMAGKPLRLDLPGLVRARDFLDSRHSVARSAELGSPRPTA